MKNRRDRPFRPQGKQPIPKQPAVAGGGTGNALFERARTHHGAGRLQEAEALYREVLQASPNHPDALHLLGVLAYQVGYAAAGLELIDRAIEARPDFAEAHFSRGNCLYGLQRFQDAVTSYERAIEQNPLYAEAYSNRGSALNSLGQCLAALESYDQAVRLKPDYVDAYANRATTLSALGQFQAAVESYDEVLFLRPDFAEAHFNRGNALYFLQQHQAAAESFSKAIRLRPDYVEAYFGRGNALQALKQYQAAVESYDKTIELNPIHAEAHSNRGGALHSLEQYEAALENYETAIRLRPEYADAYSNRGNVLGVLHRYQEALESCDRAIELNPALPDAHYNRGNILYALDRREAALESYEKAVQLKPDNVLALNNRGSALNLLERFEKALECFDRVIQLQPDYADAWYNRGNALLGLRQYQAALDSYIHAIELKPDHAEAWYNQGHILHAGKRYLEALRCYDIAIQFKPDYEYAFGIRMHMRRFMCDWEGAEAERRELEDRVARGENASVPFPVLSVSNSLEMHRQVAAIQMQDKFPPKPEATPIPMRARRDKIRIGYYSADYHNHATSYLVAELFERHDRSKFEIIGFSFGVDSSDEMRRRVSGGLDRFLDVRTMQDREVTQLSRDLEVDIAVDLKGFTQDCRTGIFAGRAAPIQVSYLGYPGTMAAEYIDYLIADPTVIPAESRQHYLEKIVYLPDSYQVNDSQRQMSTKPFTRAGEGLPDTGFVYCCFNNAYKISPEVFDVWMRVLGRVEGSVLWLLEENLWVAANLRKEAARRGIAPERLVFAKPAPQGEHLARQRLADLFLDTLPYNAHTTASDALWAGLPVLTRMGEVFPSRVAASLLRAIGLPELVTTEEAEFEELAVELARNGERYRELRQRLEENRLKAPLFDTRTFTAHLEAAYSAMYERYQAGLGPEDIAIARLENGP
jgi:predicted O-linked N-acetylglucosamine transferase (SPINDLY family)